VTSPDQGLSSAASEDQDPGYEVVENMPSTAELLEYDRFCSLRLLKDSVACWVFEDVERLKTNDIFRWWAVEADL
jgi:DNA polymerase III psi subunit